MKTEHDKREAEWEKLLHIATRGRDDSNADTYRYPYEPTPYCVLERLGNSGLIGKKNTLLDYGCGKGRVDLFLAYQTKCRCIGIEYDERIYARAEENRTAAVSGGRVEFLQEDASVHEVRPEVDRFYFFNPFSIELLRSVMGRILDSRYETPRECLLFFYYPSDEYVSYLMTVPELEFYDEIDCSDFFPENAEREKILIFSLE